jgi:hypothetical protein
MIMAAHNAFRAPLNARPVLHLLQIAILAALVEVLHQHVLAMLVLTIIMVFVRTVIINVLLVHPTLLLAIPVFIMLLEHQIAHVALAILITHLLVLNALPNVPHAQPHRPNVLRAHPIEQLLPLALAILDYMRMPQAQAVFSAQLSVQPAPQLPRTV